VVTNQGHLRHPRGEVLAHQASCLNRVTNAVIVWNTVYMAAAVEQLEQEGYPLDETDLAHIWPMRYAHLNVYAKYRFNVEETHGGARLTTTPTAGPEGLAYKISPILWGSL
jgi:Tn3 transposase DDE domain